MMSSADQVESKPSFSDSSIKHTNRFTGASKTIPEDDWDDTVNDLESLKNGIIKRSKNKTKGPYTIILVGETSVGKSSALELIANVLTGTGTLDHTNERGGPGDRSQTKSAHLYEIRSKNGIVIRILDTPGLADARGSQQDELHKKSITTQIEKYIDTVDAVLVIANGTVPRITVGTNYALSTLSAMFPKPLTKNIAFLFTNISNPVYINFPHHTLPAALKDAPQFLLNNPIALRRNYQKLNGDPTMKTRRTELLEAVEDGKENALEMLVNLFDWLDGLEPQPTMKAVLFHGQCVSIMTKITNPLHKMMGLLRKVGRVPENLRKVKWMSIGKGRQPFPAPSLPG